MNTKIDFTVFAPILETLRNKGEVYFIDLLAYIAGAIENGRAPQYWSRYLNDAQVQISSRRAHPGAVDVCLEPMERALELLKAYDGNTGLSWYFGVYTISDASLAQLDVAAYVAMAPDHFATWFTARCSAARNAYEARLARHDV